MPSRLAHTRPAIRMQKDTVKRRFSVKLEELLVASALNIDGVSGSLARRARRSVSKDQ